MSYNREINVEYDSLVYFDSSKPRRTLKRKTYGFSSLVITAVAAVFASIMIMSICLVAFLPMILDNLGYAKKEDIKGQQVTIVPGQEYSDVEAVAVKACPSIVGVVVTYLATGDSLFGSYESQSQGSGIVLDDQGHILTNHHVVSKAISSGGTQIAAGCSIKVILPNNTEVYYDATVVGYDSKTDLAVIKVSAPGLVPASIGDSSSLKVGQKVVAIGNPMGIDFMGSVTVGYISGLDRSGTGMNEFSLIQTDAAINSGNSGGALVDMSGNVIGINSLKAANSNYEGMGFAIPINEAMGVVEELIEYNHRKGQPYLGIQMSTTYTEAMASQYGLPAGTLVSEAILGGPAQTAGIQKYDIITGITITQEGIQKTWDVKFYTDLTGVLALCEPGDTVTLNVYRDPDLNGKDYTTLQVQVVLGEMDFSN